MTRRPEAPPPAAGEVDLAALRDEIDRLDDALLDLLIRRTEVARQVGQAKRALAGRDKGVPGDSPGLDVAFLRPGREARILRRLTGRDIGPLTKPVAVRIWREIFAAAVALQGPFTMAVYMPTRGAGYLEVGRDAFGAYTPATAFGSPGQVVRAVSDGAAVVGVLPLPGEGDDSAWWPHLLGRSDNTPRVVARLPVIGPGPGRGDGVEALAVACVPIEDTGDDISLLVIETSPDVSRGSLKTLLEGAGLPVLGFRDARDSGPGARLHLIEVSGLIGSDDTRLAGLTDDSAGRVGMAMVIGAYARPLAP
ncbi:chorismate mutase [Roseospirillum parvum]|uniref:chorismate mutase n=1 Tax=Roseospirillum parvum TaxID=83401 RepID=A0A1G8BRT7_9PROT|nr:chorismate mutase [Roseospirillum parvum]SDH35897.1 Chorismate mutase [Roseospirillum parvum]